MKDYKQFEEKLVKAINSAFGKDPGFEGIKVNVHKEDEEMPLNPKGIGNIENIEVYIKSDDEKLQYYAHIFVPKYQASACVLIDQAIGEQIEEVLVNSHWQRHIDEKLIITTITRG